ncbi:hypothetical protein FBU30_004698 [Linnemannia zychae]|nr:hypothetical protein FBU30_004698 [Linnemannia zychae]
MAAGVRNVLKPRMYTVFSDPVDGNLAARTLVLKGARLEDVKNPSAVAFVIPKASSWTSFLDAIWTTHAKFFAEHEDVIPFSILSNSTFPCTDGINQRIEVVFHEDLNSAVVFTTPIIFESKEYEPLSANCRDVITRFIITDFYFQSSRDLGGNNLFHSSCSSVLS